jgi:predicted nucleotide-binding protein (sugar kinase/HSP70/actin superfamily)
MKARIGIPRALLYYPYYPLWKNFFEALGCEVVVSTPTNKSILNNGSCVSENEFCLPVKIFYGHVLDLEDKVDFIFIPRIVSVKKDTYTCPKFLGLPDMIRAIDRPLPKILSPTINLNLGLRKYYSTILNVGRLFNKSYFKIGYSYISALKELNITKLRQEEVWIKNKKETSGIKIGVVGHGYNIYDSYLTMNLIKRLENLGVDPVVCDSVPSFLVEKEAATLSKELFWNYEREIVGATFHWLRNKTVDGIIYVLTFACGPDSLMQVLLEHEAKNNPNKIPFMSLVIDEHSAEAGLVTRLEAFIDMLNRREAKEVFV